MLLWNVGKRDYFSYHSNSYIEVNILRFLLFYTTRIFCIQTNTDKIELTGKAHSDKNVAISKRYIFSKRVQKLKSIVTFHDYAQNFVLQIEPLYRGLYG